MNNVSKWLIFTAFTVLGCAVFWLLIGYFLTGYWGL